MNRMVLISFAVVSTGLMGTIAQDAATTVAPAPRQVDVAALVRQLGSPRFDDRESATQRLGNLRVDAPPPELLEALKSPSPEVRRRAADAVKAIKVHAEERSLGRERTFARRGKIDRFVASAAAWDLPANEVRIWQTVLDLAVDVSKRADYYWTPTNDRKRITPQDFWGTMNNRVLFQKSMIDYEVPGGRMAGTAVLREPGGFLAPTLLSKSLNRSTVIAWEKVSVVLGIAECVILANGDVSSAKGFSVTAIIICGGNVEIAEQVSKSVVIARGNIRVGKWADRSVLIAGGNVTIEKPLKQVDQNPELANRVTENSRHPLGFISFFELSDVGVEVEPAEGGVRVSHLIADGPMAAAGVREGDVVTKVGEHAVKSAEDLRRRLRDASAVKGEAVLTLRREAATLQRRVTIPD